jgi:membrane associated rhomboid family serine protease
MRGVSSSNMGYSFGPGALTPAVKALIIANVVAFLAALAVPEMTLRLGLQPEAVLGGALWQPLTYMFLHGGVSHILFNMLSLWMFGVELERMWGTAFFTRFYLVCGVGAAATTLLLSLLPGSLGQSLYFSLTVGASGAIYGLLMAYALYFPHRIIYYIVFPMPVKVYVIIAGALSFMSAIGGPGDGVAHATHLGGLAVGYLDLKGRRLRLGSELQYRLNRWRIDRMRRRFDVHRGGKSDGKPDRGPWVH